MMHNQEQMMRERMRQGQAETEERMVLMKAILSGGGVCEPNPLIEHFKADPDVCELELDAAHGKDLMQKAYLHSCFPCLPCHVCCCTPVPQAIRRRHVDEAVAAHHLVLRESSLVLRVDGYPSAMRIENPYTSFGPTGPVPLCCLPCVLPQLEVKTDAILEVLPLEDVDSVVLEESQIKASCSNSCCSQFEAPATVVVRARGLRLPVFAIDLPRDGAAFCDKVMAQVARRKATIAQGEARPLPESWPAYLQKLGSDMMPGTMGMGMMMPPGAAPAPTAVEMHRSPGTLPSIPAATVATVAKEEEDVSTRLEKLAGLKDRGMLSQTEFDAAKKQLLLAGA